MRTHLALLRGVNVGGNNKVPMKQLRALVEGLGYGEVETYIQSGNVVFTAGDAAPAGVDRIRDELEAAMARQIGVAARVVVLSRQGLSDVVTANPYPQEEDHRRLHAVFRSGPFRPPDLEAVERAVAKARDKGSRDEVSIRGNTMYLWTPDGYGRSELAAQLARSAMSGGTARNWATVLRLDDMMGG